MREKKSPEYFSYKGFVCSFDLVLFLEKTKRWFLFFHLPKDDFNHHYNLYGARSWWRSWLRHCATSRKVAGSILYGFIEFFSFT
jgi:hypothetical protein